MKDLSEAKAENGLLLSNIQLSQISDILSKFT